jgi:hypothetical protein
MYCAWAIAVAMLVMLMPLPPPSAVSRAEPMLAESYVVVVVPVVLEVVVVMAGRTSLFARC